MNHNLNQYQNNQIQTASKEQLLIMLYDGAIRFISQASCAIESGNRTAKISLIDKAMAIINHLSGTLSHEVGGQISTDLEDLYTFVTNELCLANLNDDCERLDRAKNILLELREGWTEAIASEKESKDPDANQQSAATPA